MNKPLDSERAEWAVKGRAQNQLSTLNLYELFESYPAEIREYAYEAHNLVAVSFSLWRAVFLADRSGKLADRIIHAKEFLKRLLTDNAITFAQDRDSREWTFDYYIGNALSRMQKLAEDGLLGINADDLEPQKYRARDRWDSLQTACDEAIDALAATLKRQKRSTKDSNRTVPRDR